MLVNILMWGTVIGLIHFIVIGLLYGNPVVDKIYSDAQESEPGVKKWDSKPKYLITQFLGTQVEVFILTAGYFWLTSFFEDMSLTSSVLIAFLFSGIRVYPRFWNMWIQSTYPNKLLGIEFINGILSTFVIVLGLYFIA